MTARKGQKKSGQKSLRISARTQFGIEVCALIEKKSETAVIETAVEAHCRTVAKGAGVNLAELFHSNEGVRKLNLFLLKGFPLDDDDEGRRGFVFEHRAFFFRKSDSSSVVVVNVPNVETLWPHIDEYRAAGVKRYWAAGEAMAKALKERGIAAPDWPPKERTK